LAISPHFKISLLVLGLIFQGLFISDAFAYLDPGSGSMIFQALIGALVGVGIALKIYWDKIKFKISSRLHRDD